MDHDDKVRAEEAAEATAQAFWERCEHQFKDRLSSDDLRDLQKQVKEAVHQVLDQKLDAGAKKDPREEENKQFAVCLSRTAKHIETATILVEASEPNEACKRALDIVANDLSRWKFLGETDLVIAVDDVSDITPE